MLILSFSTYPVFLKTSFFFGFILGRILQNNFMYQIFTEHNKGFYLHVVNFVNNILSACFHSI